MVETGGSEKKEEAVSFIASAYVQWNGRVWGEDVRGGGAGAYTLCAR